MTLDEWPDCPVEGCKNKICLALDSQFCFPHTPGNEHVKRMKIDAANTATYKRDDSGDFVKVSGPKKAGTRLVPVK